MKQIEISLQAYTCKTRNTYQQTAATAASSLSFGACFLELSFLVGLGIEDFGLVELSPDSLAAGGFFSFGVNASY